MTLDCLRHKLVCSSGSSGGSGGINQSRHWLVEPDCRCRVLGGRRVIDQCRRRPVGPDRRCRVLGGRRGIDQSRRRPVGPDCPRLVQAALVATISLRRSDRRENRLYSRHVAIAGSRITCHFVS